MGRTVPGADTGGEARIGDVGEDVAHTIPRPIRVGAALSWRFLLILGAIGVIAWVLGYLAVVTIPIGIALLLSALFAPAVARLVRWKVPHPLATAIAVIGGLAVVGGVLTLVITTFSAGLPQLQDQVGASLQQINEWLHNGPLHLSQNQLQQLLDNATKALKGNASQLTSSALTTAAALGEGLTGALLTLFTLIFFLHGGDTIWRFLVGAIPTDVRNRVDVAGRRGFASLVSYVRATVAVAFVDAICIGIGLWIVGVPLAVPLATLIFLGAFVPIIGAVVAGAVAVLVALVAKGFIAAVIVLAIVVGVMQLEGHLLQPLLLGRAVRLHPLAVVLAIAIGVVVGGIAGALLAVPILAVLKSGIRSLLHDPNLSPHHVNALDAVQAVPFDEQPRGSNDGGGAGEGGPAGNEAASADTARAANTPQDQQ
ncbi:MAG: AI-2E family transporter [Sciscionella sp.]